MEKRVRTRVVRKIVIVLDVNLIRLGDAQRADENASEYVCEVVSEKN